MNRIIINPNFPISYEDLEWFVKERDSNYTLDYKLNKNYLIKNASDDIDVICKKHGNKKFISKWRYLKSDANKNTGQCKACIVEKNKNSKIKIIKFEDEKMRLHPTHPATLIDDRFKEYDEFNSNQKIQIQCLKCNDKHMVRLSNFNSELGYSCKNCTKLYRELNGHPNSLSIDKINKALKYQSFKLKSKDGPISLDTCSIICPNNHETTVTWITLKKYLKKMKNTSFKPEELCSACKNIKTLEEKKQYVSKKGFTMLCDIDQYKGLSKKYHFVCKTNPNHKRYTTLASFKKTKECLECKNEKRADKDFISFKKEIIKRGGNVKENQVYKTKTTELICYCEDAHEFLTTYERIQDNHWCSTCSQGFGERVCRIIFEHIFSAKFNSIRPKWLKSPLSDKSLELDGYNEALGIAFEYQGTQHLTNEIIKQRDASKLIQTKQKGIKLVVVPEFKRTNDEDELINIIIDLCNKINITPPKFSRNIDISAAFKGNNNEVKLNRLLKDRGARILPSNKNQSASYKGLDRKLSISCKHPLHKIFDKTPIHIIYSNGWCNSCIETKKSLLKLKKEKKEFIKLIEISSKDSIELIYDPLEPLYDPYHQYNWRCNKNHIFKLNYFELKKRIENKNSGCHKCTKIEAQLNLPYNLENKSEFKFIYEESDIDNDEYIFACCNNHKSKFKRQNLNSYQRSDSKMTCVECEKNKKIIRANKLIKTIYPNGLFLDKQLKSIAKKHSWSCGLKNHKPFQQTFYKLEMFGEKRGCETCNPRTNKKRSIEEILEIAKKYDKKISKQDSNVELLSKDINATSSAVWSCSDDEHDPFILSVDNMLRRDQWCPYCQNRNVKKKPIKGINY